MESKELFEKADEALKKGQEILAEHKDGTLSEEHAAEVKSLFDEAELYRADAEKAEEAKKLEQQAELIEKDMDQAVNSVPVVSTQEEKSMDNNDLNKKALSAYLKYGKSSMEPAERKALASNSDSDGGIFVHAELQNRLIEILDDVLQLRNLSTVVPTNKGSIPFPTFEFTGTISNVAEGATLSELSISDAFGKQSFTPHKKAILFKIPEELLEDSDFDIEGHLIDHFATRMAEELEDDIINGSGVNESLGLLNANLTAQDLTSSATNINTVSVLEAPTKLKLQYRKGGVYIMSRDQVEELNKLLDGDSRPIFRTSLMAGQPLMLNGYPLVEVERMTAPAADGDASFIFGDMKHYWIVERKGVSVKRLDERYADEGKIGFIMSMRVDGAPTVQEAFIRYNRN
jgi:HK97 family phage major capsid protein